MTAQPQLDIEPSGTAWVDGPYRYSLTREWGPAPRVCWVALNPSIADSVTNDPTLSRMMKFSRREGFGALVLVNLFARRATKPKHLKDPGDPVGPYNDDAILTAASGSAEVIVAWGAHPLALRRGADVRRLLVERGRRLLCLGTTRHGAPRHPLYLPGETELVRWAP